MCNITDNDLYMYFQAIEDTEAQSVLDIGMTLKRAGSISRSIMDGEVAESVQLVGVDFEPLQMFPVYQTVYDEVINCEQVDGIEWMDLVIALKCKELMEDLWLLVEKIRKKCHWLLLDDTEEEILQYIDSSIVLDVIELNLEDTTYYLLTMK